MIALAALAIALQGKNLLSSAVPKPTGKNGYEEYLQAADLLRGPEAAVYANWKPGAKPRTRDLEDSDDKGPTRAEIDLYAHLASMTLLQVCREELQRFGKALVLVSQGNAKPVFDPRITMGADTAFPELSSFRSLTRFASRAATVYAADGQTSRSVDVLIDQLAFADNVGRGTIISNLVGSASTAISLAAFGELLPRLSRTDVQRIQRAVTSLLARPLAARAVLPTELAMMKTALREAFAMKMDPATLFDDGDEKVSAHEKAMAREFAEMSPAKRQSMLRGIEARLDARLVAMDRILAGPERTWSSGLAALANEVEGEPADMSEAFLAILTPAYSGFATSSARIRTQLRLLDLHAKLVEYRWDYGRLPESLDAIDLLNGERYLYEKRTDGTVRLASKGIPETGEIELRYRRQADEEPGAKP